MILSVEAVLDSLTKNNVHWQRKPPNNIIVWTPGYKDSDCHAIEKYLLQARVYCIGQGFDEVCGKMYSVYKLPKITHL